MEEFLSSKCQSLLALAQYIESFFPSASYATRQTLLLDAEKAEAARLLWQTWGKRLEVFDSHERVTQVLESVVKDLRREATGEAVYIDVVREWFKNEVMHFCLSANILAREIWRFNRTVSAFLPKICPESVWKRSCLPCESGFGNK